jgi:hypothetical protein
LSAAREKELTPKLLLNYTIKLGFKEILPASELRRVSYNSEQVSRKEVSGKIKGWEECMRYGT